jgi:hypothetical protein
MSTRPLLLALPLALLLIGAAMLLLFAEPADPPDSEFSGATPTALQRRPPAAQLDRHSPPAAEHVSPSSVSAGREESDAPVSGAGREELVLVVHSRVLGRLVDVEGEPLADIPVALEQLSGDETGSPDWQAVSEATGEFELQNVPSRATLQLLIEHSPYQRVARKLVLQPGEDFALGSIVLRRGYRIEGLVVGDDDQPVPGATVFLGDRDTTQADPEGHFFFEDLPAGEFWLYAQAAGLVAVPQPPVRIALTREVPEIQLRMTAALRCSGTVLDGDGELVSGAKVTAQLKAAAGAGFALKTPLGRHVGREEVYSDTGEFSMQLSAGTWSVIARHPKHGSAVLAWTGPSPEPLVLRLQEPRCLLMGQVVAKDGGTAIVDDILIMRGKDATTTAWSQNHRISAEELAWDDEIASEGWFARKVSPGYWYKIVARGAGFPMTVTEPFEIKANGRHGPVVVEVSSGTGLQGIVRDENGRPLPDVRVQLIPKEVEGEGGWARRAAFIWATTIDDGTFLTAPLVQGSYLARLSRTGYFGAEYPVEFYGGSLAPVDWTLTPGGLLAGVILNETGGRTPQFVVTAQSLDDLDQSYRARVTGSRDGTGIEFEFAALPTGRYDVLCQAPGEVVKAQHKWDQYRSRKWAKGENPEASTTGKGMMQSSQVPFLQLERRGVEVRAGEMQWLEFSLVDADAGQVVGTVALNGELQPLARVAVHGIGFEVASAYTDGEGSFRFAGLPAGAWRVSAQVNLRTRAGASTEVWITSGRETQVDLFIQTRTLRVQVVDKESREPLPQAKVQVNYAPPELKSRQLGEGRVKSNGIFVLEDVPTKHVQFHVECRDYTSLWIEKTSDLPRGSHGAFQVRLQRAGKIRVLVLDQDGVPLSGALAVGCRSLPGSPTEFSVTRRGPGSPEKPFTITQVPPGNYELQVVHRDTGLKGKARCQVPSGKTERVKIEVK